MKVQVKYKITKQEKQEKCVIILTSTIHC